MWGRCGMAMGARGGGVVNSVLCTPCTPCTLFLKKRGRERQIFYIFFPVWKKKNISGAPGASEPQTVRKPCKPRNYLVALRSAPRSTHNPLLPAPESESGRVWVGHERHEVNPLPRDDAAAEHVRVLPQGPLGPPAPRGPHVEPRGARAGHNWARGVARAVPGGEAHRTKMGDVHAERAPGALMDPTDP